MLNCSRATPLFGPMLVGSNKGPDDNGAHDVGFLQFLCLCQDVHDASRSLRTGGWSLHLLPTSSSGSQMLAHKGPKQPQMMLTGALLSLVKAAMLQNSCVATECLLHTAHKADITPVSTSQGSTAHDPHL